MVNEILEKNEEIQELANQAVELEKQYKEMRFQEEKMSKIKKRIKEYYEAEKEKIIENDGEFDKLVIDGVYLQEVKRPTYTWKESFRETLMDLGIAHLVLKPGNQLKKRFDLSGYLLPKEIENSTLRYKGRKTPEEKEKEQLILQQEAERWDKEPIETLLERYLQYKKSYDLTKEIYDIEKNKLLSEMIEKNISALHTFALQEERDKYDFALMHGKPFEENLELATNGEIFVDLIDDKNEIMDIKQEELYNVERIKKRYRQPRLKKLTEILGENFYFIKANRVEENILNRFPIMTSAVDEMIDRGYLDNDTLKKERYIAKEEDFRTTFEIITEDAANRRYEIHAQKDLQKKLQRSGYYDSVH